MIFQGRAALGSESKDAENVGIPERVDCVWAEGFGGGSQGLGGDTVGDDPKANLWLSVKTCSCVFWVPSSETEWDPMFFPYSLCHMWGLCTGASQPGEPS